MTMEEELSDIVLEVVCLKTKPYSIKDSSGENQEGTTRVVKKTVKHGLLQDLSSEETFASKGLR